MKESNYIGQIIIINNDKKYVKYNHESNIIDIQDKKYIKDSKQGKYGHSP